MLGYDSIKNKGQSGGGDIMEVLLETLVTMEMDVIVLIVITMILVVNAIMVVTKLMDKNR